MILNIVINAAHAMAGEGVVTLTGAASDAKGFPLSLTIADRGSGIAEEDIPHLFEPFFTSRRGGGGSGLGLALCHQIAHSMGASIRVDSKPEEGSTFSILFPGRDTIEKEAAVDV